MPVTTYTVIGGVIVHENRAGVQRNYRPDTNGNTAALTDATTATDTWEYWPYGEVRTRTGTTATPFQFGGVLGYYTDSSSRLYVRARHYRPKSGRWQTRDPLWPSEAAYGYVGARPQSGVDPTGRWVIVLVIAAAVGIGIAASGCGSGGAKPKPCKKENRHGELTSCGMMCDRIKPGPYEEQFEADCIGCCQEMKIRSRQCIMNCRAKITPCKC